MTITQSYASRSVAEFDEGRLNLHLATELSRPPVALKAKVKHSAEYAQLMLSLHSVVAADLRYHKKDRSAYQAWVQKRYLEELDDVQAKLLRERPELEKNRTSLIAEIEGLEKERDQQIAIIKNDSFYESRNRYYRYLREADYQQWLVLDPVISVHADAILFEGFSLDESSYGRVTVPMDNLELEGAPCYGTTNIDFSESLAREFERVRSYRSAFIDITADQVSVQTNSGSASEKKIDLPASWIRGFLQVQSASGMNANTVYLSSETVSQILTHLRRRSERAGPRSLRFKLEYGKKPTVEIEPWGILVEECQHIYDGMTAGEIRIWGRQRLFPLERLLPLAETVEVRLLGSGMPSFWSITLEGHRFDLGLSGWTVNDWAKQAQFDLLAPQNPLDASLLEKVQDLIEKKLILTPKEVAEELSISRDIAASALQSLCQQGEAMYDFRHSAYRWRRLLSPKQQQTQSENYKGLNQVVDILKNNRVRHLEASKQTPRGNHLYSLEVVTNKSFKPTLEIDNDGRIVSAKCNCGSFRRNRLRKGPCTHLLAAATFISQSHIGMHGGNK